MHSGASHSQILWQIHQLAADVICIGDYRNISMSGKWPNPVSDGRSDFQFAFQQGAQIWDLGMGGSTNILRSTSSLKIHTHHFLIYQTDSDLSDRLKLYRYKSQPPNDQSKQTNSNVTNKGKGQSVQSQQQRMVVGHWVSGKRCELWYDMQGRRVCS